MTRGFTRILVPTDFSPPSDAALAMAKELAARFGASLHLVHVLEDPYAVAVYSADAIGYLPAGMREAWQTEAENRINTLLTPAERTQFKVTTTVLFSGSTAQAIVEHAQGNGIDLIVIGTHGLGRYRKLLIGSTTQRLLHRTFIPLAAVPLAESTFPLEARLRPGAGSVSPRSTSPSRRVGRLVCG